MGRADIEETVTGLGLQTAMRVTGLQNGEARRQCLTARKRGVATPTTVR